MAVDGREPVTVREVAWHHLAAVALRESLAAEMLYSGPPQSPASGGAVAYTGVAFTPEGLPVGHAALRWNDFEKVITGGRAGCQPGLGIVEWA
jgi:hypothetical protein